MADNEQQNVVVVQNSSSVIGVLSIVFSIIGIFAFAMIFAPLGFIFGAVAIYKNQAAGLGITGFILAIIALCLSPTFWVLVNSAGR